MAVDSIQPSITLLHSLIRERFDAANLSRSTSFADTRAAAAEVWARCSSDLDIPSGDTGSGSLLKDGVKEAVIRLLKEETAAVVVRVAPCLWFDEGQFDSPLKTQGKETVTPDDGLEALYDAIKVRVDFALALTALGSSELVLPRYRQAVPLKPVDRQIRRARPLPASRRHLLHPICPRLRSGF